MCRCVICIRHGVILWKFLFPLDRLSSPIPLAILPNHIHLSLSSDRVTAVLRAMAPHSAMDVEVTAVTDTSAVIIPDPLNINGVLKRRTAAGILVAGVAAPVNVESYKGETQHTHKPLSKRWDHRLSAESRSRTGNSLKAAAKYLKNPGLISLGGGLPSSE